MSAVSDDIIILQEDEAAVVRLRENGQKTSTVCSRRFIFCYSGEKMLIID